MTIKSGALQVLRARLSHIVAAFVVLVSVFSATTPAAQAGQAKGAAHANTSSAGALASPGLFPFYRDTEVLIRDLSTPLRDIAINNCPSAYVCVAVGEGDGQHTVFKLYRCTERTISNFLGYGAVANSQTGNVTVRLKKQDGTKYQDIPVSSTPARVYWDPVWYIDPCL
ncbi:hypothetical protein [Nonomuraea rhizosphaerae]|uniref:hypothetical protein n=1 Tax=Nonomuraea rhizosphaerae TaxID=2665663 RepID=UPI001C5E2E83|nr:hypothetical protein [Nonomuraea rhizosphaerae]